MPQTQVPTSVTEDGTTTVAELRSVSKRFGDVPALEKFDLVIPKARITVLLGPNGAGKTTAIRLVTGALSPTEGTISVFGTTPDGPDGENVRRRCGVVSAKPSLYDRLSGYDNLRYAAELYGLGPKTAADLRIREAAAQFGIDDALGQEVGGYSTGMKTRLALARAVLHEPELLLLDEPTSGLDPESALAVLAMVREMTATGRTVLMCTHLLAEAEGLADEVVVIQRGTTLVSGNPTDLAHYYWPQPEVTITTSEPGRLADVAALPGVRRVDSVDGGVRLELDAVSRTPEIVRALASSGVPIDSVVPYRPSLEDLYLAVRRDLGSQQDEDGVRPMPTGGQLTTSPPTLVDATVGR